jgi:hypothetical protein
VARIHERAVTFYERQDGVIARAEEIYHRLSLKQEAGTVDARWMEGVEPYLSGALDELGPRECAYLAARLKRELPPEVLAQAKLEDWERSVERRVLEFMALGHFDRVLVELHARQDRTPGSRLYLLEAESLARTMRWEEARSAAARGLDSIAEGGDVLLQCDLHLLRAQAGLHLGALKDAHEDLQEVEALLRYRIDQGRASDSRLRRLATALLLRLELARRDVPSQASEIEELREQMRATVGHMSDAELSSDPELLRRAALEARAEDRHFLSRMVKLGAPKLPGFATLRALARALAMWDAAVSTERGESPGMLARSLGYSVDKRLFNTWEALLLQRGTLRAVEVVPPLLQEHHPTGDVVEQLLELFRAASEETRGARSILSLRQESSGRRTRQDSAPLLDEKMKGPPSLESGAPAVRLTNSQLQELHHAFVNSFDQDSLAQMVRSRLGKSLATISLAGPLEETVFRLIQVAESQGWLLELLTAARESRPGNAKLQALSGSLGLTPSVPQNLERLWSPGAAILDVSTWGARLGETAAQVCRVELGRGAYGTGFLVGPDTLLTAAHLVQGWLGNHTRPDEVLFRFDFTLSPDGETLSAGTIYRLAEQDWLLAWSSALDYVLLRLAGAPGVEPVGGDRAEAFAPRRGWIDVADRSLELVRGSQLFIVQHSEGRPLSLSVGDVLGVNADGTRIRYSNSTGIGSSGAPCFSAGWNLVALHVAATMDSSGEKLYNEGIALPAIRRHLAENGKLHLLGESGLP